MEHALEYEEAQHPATSAQRLGELSADPRLRSLVAGNPAAPSNLLEGLAEDQDSQVRQMVASNPNTPWPVLERLAGEFPRAFLSNPAMLLQILARPEQISMDDLFWGALLREAELPLPWWNWLNSHPMLRARPALRLHVQMAGETPHFAGDPLEAEDIVLTLVELLTMASDRQVPLPMLQLPDQPVTAGEQIIVEHLRRLAQSRTIKARRDVAEHPRMPEEVLRLLARDQDAEVRAAVARNPHMPEEVLRFLAHDQSARARAALTWNSRTPEEILRLLARDQDTMVLEHVARNPQTPEEILHALIDKPRHEYDEYEEVRVQIATNPGASEEVLRLLTHDENPRVRAALTWNSRTPEEILRLLARDQAEWVRADAARNLQTPEEILHILAHDQAPQVRAGVVWNRRTPEDVLRLLAHDQDEAVRAAVAANPRTPENVLLLLAHDPASRVRHRVQFVLRLLDAVEEPGDREHMSTILSQVFHPDSIVEASINEQVGMIAEEVLPGRYGNGLELTEHIRQTLIAALAAGWDASKVRTAVPNWSFSQGDLRRQIMTAFMPPIALQKLALSPFWEIRYLVALQPRTPQETRQRLCQDGNRYVRAMARAITEGQPAPGAR